MGRIEAFTIPGCECWFYTGDHGPHHFHAGVADQWEVRVFFMHDPVAYEVKFCVRRLSAPLLRRVLTVAAENRGDLLKEWDRHVADE